MDNSPAEMDISHADINGKIPPEHHYYLPWILKRGVWWVVSIVSSQWRAVLGNVFNHHIL